MQLRPAVRVVRVQRVLDAGRDPGCAQGALQRAAGRVLCDGDGPARPEPVGHVEPEQPAHVAGDGGVHRSGGAGDPGELPQQRVRARGHQAGELPARPPGHAHGEEAVPGGPRPRHALARCHLLHARRLRPAAGHFPGHRAVRLRARAPRAHGLEARRPGVSGVHAAVPAEGAAAVAGLPGRQQGVPGVQEEDGDERRGAVPVHSAGVPAVHGGGGEPEVRRGAEVRRARGALRAALRAHEPKTDQHGGRAEDLASGKRKAEPLDEEGEDGRPRRRSAWACPRSSGSPSTERTGR